MNTKTYYLFNDEGEYAGIYEAQESPREPGVYIHPVNSTDDPAPAVAQNEAAFRVNEAWVVFPDFRGLTAYDQATGQSVEITQIGSLPANHLLAPPPPAPAAIWDHIKAERDRRTENGGYKVTVSGVAKWFHSDQKSRSQQLGLNLLAIQVLAGGGNASTPLPGVTPWRTMDGSEVVMTAGLAQKILAAAAASDSAIFDAAKTHKVAMEASVDPSAYDFSTNWPQTYAEFAAQQQPPV